MDWINNKQTWEPSQIKEFDRCLTKAKLSSSDDPTIFVRNSSTGRYERGGISDYRDKDTSAFWRDGISQRDMKKTGTLVLPFPENKKIRIENVHSVIITWRKNHIDWGDKQAVTLHKGLCYMIPDLEEM